MALQPDAGFQGCVGVGLFSRSPPISFFVPFLPSFLFTAPESTPAVQTMPFSCVVGRIRWQCSGAPLQRSRSNERQAIQQIYNDPFLHHKADISLALPSFVAAGGGGGGGGNGGVVVEEIYGGMPGFGGGGGGGGFSRERSGSMISRYSSTTSDILQCYLLLRTAQTAHLTPCSPIPRRRGMRPSTRTQTNFECPSPSFFFPPQK